MKNIFKITIALAILVSLGYAAHNNSSNLSTKLTNNLYKLK